MSDLFEYIIEGQKQFAVNGKMEKSGEKASLGWTCVAQEEFIKLELRILTPGIVHSIEVKAINTFDRIRVVTKDSNKNVIDSRTNDAGNRQIFVLEFKAIKECHHIEVILYNNSMINMHLGLKYFIIKGTKTQSLSKKTIHNLSKDSIKYVSPIFGLDPKIKDIEQKINERRKTEISKNEKELQKVLKISEKEYEKINKKEAEKKKELIMHEKYEKLHEDNKRNENIIINLEEESNSVRQYTIKNLENYSKTYNLVNEKWLDAQRLMEERRNVRREERLSNHLTVKIMNQKKIFVDPALGNKREAVCKMCRLLGATLVDTLTEYTIVISNLSSSALVKEAKKTRHVEVVRPTFVEESKKYSMLMPISDYRI